MAASSGASTGDTRRLRGWRWSLFLLVANCHNGRHATAVPVMGLCAREPKIRVDCYPPVESFPNATEEACLAQGCCWKQLDNDGIPCAFDAIGPPDERQCENVIPASRLACRNPRFAADELTEKAAVCEEIGCCYDQRSSECYQPFFEGYELLTLDETHNGWRGTLMLRRFKRGPFGNDMPLLQLHVVKQSSSIVRVRISDPSFARYEVPLDVPASASTEDKHEDQYAVHFNERPFGIAVTRRDTNEVLFNSTPDVHATTSFNGLVFENQFLEISTHLETNKSVGRPFLYGLGEQQDHTSLRVDHSGDQYPLFATAANDEEAKQGSVHPFYLQVLASGRSHGVFFLSSNAMDVITQLSAVTFRTNGGILDFFVFTGPTAANVTDDYTSVVGRPEMPPIWALGYHFGKRGNQTLEGTMLDVAKLRLAGLPFDSYWQDTSYAFEQEAFTLDEHAFPFEETRAFIDDLHFNNQYYVLQVSPSIPTEASSPRTDGVMVIDDGQLELDCASSSTKGDSSSTYYPLERGVDVGVFVNGVQGQEYAEKRVGPQWSAFVDFFHPNATSYWHEMLHNFHAQVLPFDGVYTEGNALTSSCDAAFTGANASCDSFTRRDQEEIATVSFASLGDVKRAEKGQFIRSMDIAYPFDPFRQPFVPGQDAIDSDEAGNMNAGTLPMAAVHYESLHYNVHSLYSRAQARSTRIAMDKIVGRRSLSVSGSSFAGSGHYTGHLLADSPPVWKSVRRSIADVIAMNLVGMPLVGPRIGGRGADVSKELMIRWHQAASFFPLAVSQVSEEDAAFDQESANIIRVALLRRYQHLRYLYTQFYRAHVQGHPVVRALAFDFPEDRQAHQVEAQYLVGPGLMIAPVVEAQAIATNVYFPNATWYDLQTGRRVISSMTSESEGDRFELVLAPLDTLPTFVRGGNIIPTQQASTTVAMTKRGVYTLTIALDTDAGEPNACGELFLDDGDSLNSIKDRRFSLMAFEARMKNHTVLKLSSQRLVDGYHGPEMHVDISTIVVYGLSGGFHSNSSLYLHGIGDEHGAKVDYFEHASMLVITQLHTSIGDSIKLSIEAKNEAIQPGGGVEGKSGSGESGSSSTAGDDGAADQHGGNHPPHREEEITGEQHGGRKGITTIGIIAIVAGVIFVAGILIVVWQRRYRGYNPIT